MDYASQPERSADAQDADAPDRPPPAGLAIDLDAPADLNVLQSLAARLAECLAPCAGEVRVRMIDDDTMAAMHAEHKNVPGTTDVLTFDLSDRPNDPAHIDADLLVCIDEAHRQAATRGIPIEHELLLYITHGILHCAGYNDDTEANAAAMHAREDQLLSILGIGPVYSAAVPSTEAES